MQSLYTPFADLSNIFHISLDKLSDLEYILHMATNRFGGRIPDRHGTHYCYVMGCRCNPCKDANSSYLKKYRKSKKRGSR